MKERGKRFAYADPPLPWLREDEVSRPARTGPCKNALDGRELTEDDH